MSSLHEDLVDQSISEAVLCNALQTSGSMVSEEELAKVLSWVGAAVSNWTLLRMLCKGSVQIQVGKDGGIEFKPLDEPMDLKDAGVEALAALREL